MTERVAINPRLLQGMFTLIIRSVGFINSCLTWYRHRSKRIKANRTEWVCSIGFSWLRQSEPYVETPCVCLAMERKGETLEINGWCSSKFQHTRSKENWLWPLPALALWPRIHPSSVEFPGEQSSSAGIITSIKSSATKTLLRLRVRNFCSRLPQKLKKHTEW